jgi:hypothetical protein
MKKLIVLLVVLGHIVWCCAPTSSINQGYTEHLRELTIKCRNRVLTYKKLSIGQSIKKSRIRSWTKDSIATPTDSRSSFSYIFYPHLLSAANIYKNQSLFLEQHENMKTINKLVSYKGPRSIRKEFVDCEFINNEIQTEALNFLLHSVVVELTIQDMTDRYILANFCTDLLLQKGFSQCNYT